MYNGGDPPAEFRLLMGQVDGILVPLALFAFAFSTYHSAPWVVPVLASGTYFILHVFVHVHRRRVPAARCERAGVQHDDADGVCGGVSSVYRADVPRFRHRRSDAALGLPDDRDGTTSVCASVSSSSTLPFCHFHLYFHLPPPQS